MVKLGQAINESPKLGLGFLVAISLFFSYKRLGVVLMNKEKELDRIQVTRRSRKPDIRSKMPPKPILKLLNHIKYKWMEYSDAIPSVECGLVCEIDM